MGAIASQITSLIIVYSIVYSDVDQRKHQSSASLAFVRGIHRRPVNSPHKWPVTRKKFPFDDVIMKALRHWPLWVESTVDRWIPLTRYFFTWRLPDYFIHGVSGKCVCYAVVSYLVFCCSVYLCFGWDVSWRVNMIGFVSFYPTDNVKGLIWFQYSRFKIIMMLT